MKTIDETRLDSDLAYRFEFLAEFMGFSEDDISTIHGAAEHVAPLVPTLVDAVYDKLFSFDITRKHFVPRQSGYDGAVPESADELTVEHEMIQYRKQHLARYLTRLVTSPYDESLLAYLDLVGKIHTAGAGSDALVVPLVQMNALLGFVSDALISVISGLGLDAETTTQTVRAFNKLLWLQNDLINRHYAASAEVVEA